MGDPNQLCRPEPPKAPDIGLCPNPNSKEWKSFWNLHCWESEKYNQEMREFHRLMALWTKQQIKLGNDVTQKDRECDIRNESESSSWFEERSKTAALIKRLKLNAAAEIAVQNLENMIFHEIKTSSEEKMQQLLIEQIQEPQLVVNSAILKAKVDNQTSNNFENQELMTKSVLQNNSCIENIQHFQELDLGVIDSIQLKQQESVGSILLTTKDEQFQQNNYLEIQSAIDTNNQELNNQNVEEKLELPVQRIFVGNMNLNPEHGDDSSKVLPSWNKSIQDKKPSEETRLNFSPIIRDDSQVLKKEVETHVHQLAQKILNDRQESHEIAAAAAKMGTTALIKIDIQEQLVQNGMQEQNNIGESYCCKDVGDVSSEMAQFSNKPSSSRQSYHQEHKKDSAQKREDQNLQDQIEQLTKGPQNRVQKNFKINPQSTSDQMVDSSGGSVQEYPIEYDGFTILKATIQLTTTGMCVWKLSGGTAVINGNNCRINSFNFKRHAVQVSGRPGCRLEFDVRNINTSSLLVNTGMGKIEVSAVRRGIKEVLEFKIDLVSPDDIQVDGVSKGILSIVFPF